MMKLCLAFICVFSLVACAKKEKVNYDKVQMNVPLSSSMLGLGYESENEKIIAELWNFCQENKEDESGKGLFWRVTFFNDETKEEKIFTYSESQKEVYDELMEMYNTYNK